jgi:DNA-binding CsgD family transcriptional regulator
VVIGISFIASVLLLSWLIEAFREDTALLRVLYIAIALAMAILYLLLEPYLLYGFQGRGFVRGGQGPPPGGDQGLSADPTADAGADADADADAPGAARVPLTERERQVARELMEGYGNRQIGERLFISPSTVATHRRNIYAKLEVHNVAGLIAKLEGR